MREDVTTIDIKQQQPLVHIILIACYQKYLFSSAGDSLTLTPLSPCTTSSFTLTLL